MSLIGIGLDDAAARRGASTARLPAGCAVAAAGADLLPERTISRRATRPRRCDGGTPAGAGKRQFSGGSLPYAPHGTLGGTFGARGTLDRVESRGLAGGTGVTGGVIPGVNRPLRPTYTSGAALRV